MKSGPTVLSGASEEFIIGVADGVKEEVAIQISGTFVGTIQLQATLDDVTYFSLQVEDLDAGTSAVDMTAVGLFRASLAGFNNAKVIMTAFTSGAATVSAQSVQS